jgi:DNA polymerase I-like protein with 3'-5' exonuclease and polymerase domains
MLEGPKGSADMALARVVECMENPWKNLMGLQTPPLRVQLAVDANIADNWYEAK